MHMSLPHMQCSGWFAEPLKVTGPDSCYLHPPFPHPTCLFIGNMAEDTGYEHLHQEFGHNSPIIDVNALLHFYT